MRLIGQKWKRGDTWSGLILIGRGLILYTFLTIESISDLVLKESPILSIPFSSVFEEIRSLSEVESGDNGKEVTPVPMPNTAVKLFCADGSWRLPPARVGRCRAIFYLQWRISSAGRASALQAEGRRFDPVILHHALLCILKILFLRQALKSYLTN